MDAPGLMVLTIFGAFCVVFGLAMVPLWRRVRRARLKRREAMMLSTARARERLLWLNAFGSIALGGALLGMMQVELHGLLQQRVRETEVARIERQCRRGLLTLRNRGDQPRHVHAANAALLEYQGYLGEEPERWTAIFDKQIYQVLQPGEQVEIGVHASTPGVCEPPASGSIWARVDEPLFARRTECRLVFELTIGDIQERVSCRMQ